MFIIEIKAQMYCLKYGIGVKVVLIIHVIGSYLSVFLYRSV